MFLLEYAERNLGRAPKGAALSTGADSTPHRQSHCIFRSCQAVLPLSVGVCLPILVFTGSVFLNQPEQDEVVYILLPSFPFSCPGFCLVV